MAKVQIAIINEGKNTPDIIVNGGDGESVTLSVRGPSSAVVTLPLECNETENGGTETAPAAPKGRRKKSR